MIRHKAIAWGLDYVRYRVFSDSDVEYIARLLPFLEMDVRNYHGSKFVDLTGKQLETMRWFCDIDAMVQTLAELFPVNRIDIFVDVAGDKLPDANMPGTVIMNNKRVETLYSCHLQDRGDVPIFARAYDARAAKHYDVQVTRFECEYKREMSKELLGVCGWKVNPVGLALHNIATIFNVYIEIGDIRHIDFHAPRRKYEHDRARFYTRYGRNILLDLEAMGVEKLYAFIMECLTEKDAKDA